MEKFRRVNLIFYYRILKNYNTFQRKEFKEFFLIILDMLLLSTNKFFKRIKINCSIVYFYFSEFFVLLPLTTDFIV